MTNAMMNAASKAMTSPMTNTVLRFLLARMAERSTAGGLVAAALGIAGYTLPELIDTTTTVVVALAGAALAFLPTGGTHRD